MTFGASGTSATSVAASLQARNTRLVEQRMCPRFGQLRGTDVDYVLGFNSTQNTFLSRGYNLVGDGNAVATAFVQEGDQTGVADPGLSPLANNGGTTQTHAVLAGSPAIDRGAPTGCPATDQRGFDRPQGGGCDTGSLELDLVAPRVSAATPTGTGIGRGTNVSATFSEKMDPATITKSTFKLFKVTSGGTTQVTNVTVTSSPGGLRATLNPFGTSTTLLAAGTRYKAVVTTGAEDLAGNRLDQNPSTAGDQQKTWTFTTNG